MPAGCSKKPLPDQKLLQKKLRKTSNAEKLTKKIEKLAEVLKSIESGISSSKDVSDELKEIKGIKTDLARLDKAIKRDFAKTREVLDKIDSKEKDKIQARVEKDYSKKFAYLSKSLSSITSEKDAAQLKTQVASLQAWIDKVTPKPVHQPLGTDLPHRVVDYKAGPPTLGTGIAPAYVPNLPNVEPSTLPKTPTDDDLAETIEVQFTDDITILTAQLEHNPVMMYEWVKNNIVYEPYYGSRKGANETLWEKGGNDFDQASLLIALYRKSGIPARYVYGVVEIPIDKAMNWVGVEKPEVAARVFSAGGIPSQAVISGGQITAIRLEHVWTEVYVNYENYRGLDLGEGNKEWIPLDPSFKQYERIKPDDISSFITQEDKDLITSTVASSIETTTFGLSGLDFASIGQAMDEVSTRTAQSLQQTYNEENVWKLLGKDRIIPQNLGLLPPTLESKVISVSNEWQNIPSSQRVTVEVKVTNSSRTQTLLSYTSPLASFGEKRLTLAYEAHTEEDASILSQYSSINDVPAYLVKLHPVLLLDGQKLSAEEEASSLGSDQWLLVTINSPRFKQTVDSPVNSGSHYAIVFDLGRVATQALKNSSDAFKNEMDKFKGADPESQVSIHRDNLIGGLLHGAGLWYFAELDAANNVFAKMQNLIYIRDISIATTGAEAETACLFNTPVHISLSGLFFDVGSDSALVGSKLGNTESVVQFNMQAGAMSSLLEGMAWKYLLGNKTDLGISSVAILMQALSEGKLVLQIDSNNLESALAKLNAPDYLKDEIRNFINQGNVVVIPEGDVNINSWKGFGYVVSDPETGSAGYIISGELAGGMTTWDSITVGLSGLLWCLLCAPMDPMSRTVLTFVSLGIACLAIEKAYYDEVEFIQTSRLSPERKQMWIERLAVASYATIALMTFCAIRSLNPTDYQAPLYNLMGFMAAVIFVVTVQITYHTMIETEIDMTPYQEGR